MYILPYLVINTAKKMLLDILKLGMWSGGAVPKKAKTIIWLKLPNKVGKTGAALEHCCCKVQQG